MEKKRLYCSYTKDMLLLFAGNVLYAISVCAIDGIETMPAGGVGIATVLHYITSQSIGRMNLMVNIPLMAVGTMVLGKKMLIYTGIVILESSLLIDFLMPFFPARIEINTMILTLIGAVLMGIASGMIMSTGATFAGTSVIAKLISQKKTGIKIGSALIVMDGMVISAGAIVLKNIMALFYSAVYTVIVSSIINYILYILPSIKNRHINPT